MKSIKNFFILFFRMFAWIFIIAVISLFVIRVIEKFVVLDDNWQICITCMIVNIFTYGVPKFHNLIFGNCKIITSFGTDTTTDDSK